MRSPMIRNLLAAIAGYAVMFVAAFVLFSAMWTILGPNGSFRSGVWEVSSAWITGSIVLGFLVSAAGGYTCAKLSASRRGVTILVGMVLAVGLLAAFPDPTPVEARPDGVSMLHAMASARQPAWLLWLNPVFGVVGVVLGARLESRAAGGDAA